MIQWKGHGVIRLCHNNVNLVCVHTRLTSNTIDSLPSPQPEYASYKIQETESRDNLKDYDSPSDKILTNYDRSNVFPFTQNFLHCEEQTKLYNKLYLKTLFNSPIEMT